MANGLFVAAKKKMLEGDLGWDDGPNKVALIDTGVYSVNLAADDFYDDADAGEVAISGNLSGLTTTGAVADANDITIADVAGNTVEAAVTLQDSGDPATSPMFSYHDTGAGFPLTPNGGDVDVIFHSSGVFAL